MAKRKRSPKGGVRITVTVPNEVDGAVNKLEGQTGWSYSYALGYLARAGVTALYGGGPGVEAMRGVLTAQIEFRESEKLAQMAVAAKRAQLRNAQAEAKQRTVDMADMPDRPPRENLPAVGKRGPGRPRKHPLPPAANRSPLETPAPAEGSNPV